MARDIPGKSPGAGERVAGILDGGVGFVLGSRGGTGREQEQAREK